jgi:hypothetical protein
MRKRLTRKTCLEIKIFERFKNHIDPASVLITNFVVAVALSLYNSFIQQVFNQKIVLGFPIAFPPQKLTIPEI